MFGAALACGALALCAASPPLGTLPLVAGDLPTAIHRPRHSRGGTVKQKARKAAKALARRRHRRLKHGVR